MRIQINAAPRPGAMTKRRGPVLIRWFISYLAILLIPLALSIAVYFYSLNIINKSSEEIYEASLEQFRIEVDNFFSGALQALQQVSINTDIQLLTLVKEDLEPKHRWNIYMAVGEIRKFRNILPLVDDIFVVLNPLDSVVSSSSHFSMDLFYDLYFENDELSLDEFRALMREPQRNEIVLLKDKLLKDTLLLLQTSAGGTIGDSSATLAISFKKELIDSRFFNSYEATGGRIFLRQKNSSDVYGRGNGDEIITFQDNKGTIDHISYRVFSVDSRILNGSYLYFIPENLERAKARQIQIFTFIGLFVCTLLGLFLSFLMSKRNYDPVRKLIAIFDRSDGMSDGIPGGKDEFNREDEFNWIEKRAIDTQRTLGNNYRVLRNHCIHTLLEKPFDPVHGKSEMERYNISLAGEWNLVAVFTIPGFPSSGKVLSENEIEVINAMQYIVRHIFIEAVDNSFSAEICDAGEYTAAIINWTGDMDTFVTQLEEIIEYTQQEAGDLLCYPVVTALGEPRRGIEGVYYSNLEAMETLRYLDLNTGQSIMHYKDIRYSGGKYRYSHETERKLINLIRVGDAEAAVDLLRQIWAENPDYQNNRKMTRLLSYNILGSLAQGMEQDTAPEDMLPLDFSLENIPPRELADTLEKAVNDICRSNSLLRLERREYQLSAKVKKYIEENYKNPDTNIAITSLHFGLSPKYLSGVFKEETGLGLLDYINTLRIEESKRLLKSGCDVNETAERSGFRGVGTFIRVFKKLTGVTPGQYREL